MIIKTENNSVNLNSDVASPRVVKVDFEVIIRMWPYWRSSDAQKFTSVSFSAQGVTYFQEIIYINFTIEESHGED
jgi:hypothetical protein